EEVLTRLKTAVQSFSWIGRLGYSTGGTVGQLENTRVRIWRSGTFVRQPSRGALVLDATVDDWGSSTVLSGRLRMGYTYMFNLVWIVIFAIALAVRFLGNTWVAAFF